MHGEGTPPFDFLDPAERPWRVQPAARATWQGGAMATLTRPRRGKVIAGVCAALANRFGLSPFLVRLLFVLSLLLPGPQVLLYLVLWVVFPKEGR